MSDVTENRQLVQIKKKESAHDTGEAGISRRGFLKLMGTASALGVAGCADSAKQRIYPHVKGQEDQIPGVSVWFASTCTECSAGCGVMARNADGRTVKVEGNSEHPVNRGGLCGLGQASLQALYDPDRIRQPMKWDRNSGKPVLKPVSWKQAYKTVADALKKSKKNYFLSGETTGTLDRLLADWCDAMSAKRVVYDPLQPVNFARASELVYGRYGVPRLHLERADVIVNFGADFLETWISPVEYARGWADGRRKEHSSRVIHIEPRLSLTGSNADTWLTNAPGSETQVALLLLKLLLELGRGQSLKGSVRERLQGLVKDVSTASVVKSSGIPEEKILLVARRLHEAPASLVLAGGAAGESSQAVDLQVVCAFLNLVLSNVGNTVDIAAMREPASSLEGVRGFVDAAEKGDVGVVFVHGANPAFDVPSEYRFEYALRQIPLKVSFSSHLDETTTQADLILPAHHALEDWGDVVPHDGVRSLVQPTMTPLFDTRSFGSSLLELAKQVGKDGVAGGASDYASYLKASWQGLYEGEDVGFEQWFRETLKTGGKFDDASSERVKVKVSDDAFHLSSGVAEFAHDGVSEQDPILFPFPSVKSFDGRAANRPWLQELPDPVTQIAWDGWVEMHPSQAKKRGIVQGDLVTIRNKFGEVNVPAFVTDYVHPDIVAVPVGQGHTAFGRFAKEVSEAGNVFRLLPARVDGVSAGLLSTRVAVTRAQRKTDLVVAQDTNSQFGREFARTNYVEDQHHDDHMSGGHGGEHHEPKQMYEQRGHPVYSWGLAVDLAACTGCSACVVACYAENNIPVVGKEISGQGREMSWLRIERYYDSKNGGDPGTVEELKVSFLPMMCQQCNNAPCEPVCPVYATYHNEEGLNVMAYNRCVGTRYCSNNCSYKVRRYNWFEYDFPEPMNLQLNPDITKRSGGVMEKCTFCIQRIAAARDRAMDLGRLVEDGEVSPACVQSCPTKALTFGNLNDPKSQVNEKAHDKRGYKVLDHHLNTQPSITYLSDVRHKLI